MAGFSKLLLHICCSVYSQKNCEIQWTFGELTRRNIDCLTLLLKDDELVRGLEYGGHHLLLTVVTLILTWLT